MNDWLVDLRTAVTFLTRVPLPHPEGMPAPGLPWLRARF